MQARQCNLCKFWNFEDMSNYGAEIGKCLRYPPILDPNRIKRMAYEHDELKKLGSSIDYGFPLTTKSQWCGEFKVEI